MMDDVLREYISKICYVYIDDIIIFSKTSEEHIRDIYTIFKRHDESGRKINLEKTQFMNLEVAFLGYLVTSSGLSPNPKKIEAIESLLPHTNLKELKSFLGLTGYFRKFIKNYARVAQIWREVSFLESRHLNPEK